MFEVAWCVMLYSTVLAIEFSPVVFERFRLEGPQRVIRAISTPLVITGVVLSTLHQSSLGTVFLIVPSKLHPLWYTPLLPLFFYLSAIGAGLGMVVLESRLSERAFGHRPPIGVLEPLARAMVLILGVYGLLRILVLRRNGALAGLLHPGYEETMFLIEIVLGVIVPVGLLVRVSARTNRNTLTLGALCAVLGFVMNRLNVSITGMERAAGVRYIPSWMEVAVSLGLVAVGFVAFAVIARHFPVFPDSHEEQPPAAA
jgi:Ni/Fe-hydrogenase subunit HybB-like protein